MLKRIQLGNFRNYKTLNLEFPEGFSVLTGANGTGKSNLLESIFYLGAGYSYRQFKDETLVRLGSDFFSVRGDVQSGTLIYNLEVVYQLENKRKIAKTNGKKDLLGKSASYLPVVIFSPIDLLILQGAPGIRRRLLDLIAYQAFPQHATDMHQYRSVLLQRNNLLKRGISREAELTPWDEQLAAFGARILSRRLKVFGKLVELSGFSFQSLGGIGNLGGLYVSEVIPECLPSADEATCRILYMEALKKWRPREERFRMTMVGPHRDDLKFSIDGHEARYYCSQGEQRLIALSLKMGQNSLIRLSSSVEPLLLLDDVFSELDEQRREMLLKEFSRYNQVIATTTVQPSQYTTRAQITPEVSLFMV
jgi:DNA replication and repair protein RecF